MDSKEVSLKEYESEEPKFKMIKYHVFIVIVFLIVLLFLLLAGKFGGDSIPFILFTLIMSLPILIIYRNQIPDYIPKPFSDLLIEEEKPKTEKIEYESVLDTKTTKSKQILYLLGIIVLSISLILLIIGLNNDLKINDMEIIKNKKIGTKILTGLVIAIMNGIMLIKFGELSNKKL